MNNSLVFEVSFPLNSKVFFRMGLNGSHIQEAVVIKYEFALSGNYAEVFWYDEAQRKRVEYLKIDELYKSRVEAQSKIRIK